MKTTEELLQERKDRVRKAVAHEKVDRTPLVVNADAFCARHIGVKMADFCATALRSNEVMIQSCQELGDFEGLNSMFAQGFAMPLGFMSAVKMPGKELPEDAVWQLDEKEAITVEDYDAILNKGWFPVMTDIVTNRLHVDIGAIMGELSNVPTMIENMEKAGYVVYAPVTTSSVPELLGGGRSMPKFMRDLYKMPDKVEAVLDVIQNEMMFILRRQIQATNASAVFLSPARGASMFFAPKLWERFVWKYLKAAADVIIEEGAIVNFHIDSNWERDLEFFKAMPKGKCVFETDGTTDIYKVKAVLGDSLCIKGDVPPGMMTVGTPDDVYEYCTKLIRDMGPGFILSTGCTVPPEAKVENVKAMIAACHDH